MTVEEVDAVIAASERTGRGAVEAFMYRHHPQTLHVKALVDAGAIGQIQMIRGAFSFPLTDESNIRLNATLGSGSIWDVGCNPISWIGRAEV